jgi:uncharacterized protein YhbP (UPF0306 family)
MPIEHSKRPVAPARMERVAHELLDASTLCAVATVGPGGRAHVNTAYFAWSHELEVVWLSEPRATHSRNVRANPSVAIAVYESDQSWGEPDRGIQLFGRAHEATRAGAAHAESLYAGRFAEHAGIELRAYRFYVFRARRVKLFDERTLGAGAFVTADVAADGRLRWLRTEVYDVGGVTSPSRE